MCYQNRLKEFLQEVTLLLTVLQTKQKMYDVVEKNYQSFVKSYSYIHVD